MIGIKIIIKNKNMGIWAGRLGKSLGAIKKEGFKSGSKKIVSAIKIMVKPVLPGDVLLITGGTGRSAIYRCHNQAEELNLHRIKASVAMQDNKKILKYANTFDVFIFHRVVVNMKIEALIAQIKKQNKMILFETDDLNYDSEYLRKTDYFAQINDLERKQIEHGVGAQILGDEYVQHCVTSTSFLAGKLEEKGKQVFISKNKLAVREIEEARAALEKRRREEDKMIRIGYFSGTPSHDKDFATIEDVLVEILKKHQNVRLFLAGPLEIGEKFKELKEQVEQVPFVPMSKHLENISKVDINIVPLENNDFCRAKSEIKFIEAGIVNVPSVAVGNQTHSEAIEDGVDGFLAHDDEQWKQKIEKLIEDKELREKMGIAAHSKVLEKFTTNSMGNEEYYNFLKSKIKND